MAVNVYRSRSRSVTLKEKRGESMSKEIAAGDDMTIRAMKDEIARKLAGGRHNREIRAKPSKSGDGGDGMQIIGGEVVADTNPNSASKVEQPLAKENNSGWSKKEEEGRETKSVMNIDENCITLRRKRGADGEMILAYLSLHLHDRSSPRLRPRQVPIFRMVDLGENDVHRIVGKRIKVYWPESRKWFTGHIKAFNAEKGLHSVVYDDGDKELLNLRMERFELEILPNEGFNLKADSSSKKKGRGLDANAVSPLMLPEAAFKVEDSKELIESSALNVKSQEVMKTLESKMENVSKKVGKSGSSRLQRKSTKAKWDSAPEMEKVDAKMKVDVNTGGEVMKCKSDADIIIEKAMEVDHLTGNQKTKCLEEVAEKYAEGQITVLALAAGKNKENLEDGNVNGDMEDEKEPVEPENITASEDAVISSMLSFHTIKDKTKDLPPAEKVKKIKLEADINIEKAMEVDHPTDNQKTKSLEEVGEKSAQGQITILALVAGNNKESLEDGNVNGDMEDEKKQVEPQNIIASEDAVISSMLSFRTNKDKTKDLPPTEKVEEAIKEISAQVATDVDMQQTQMKSALSLTTEIACIAVSKLHLPKNPEEGNADLLPEDLKSEKHQPEEASKQEMKSASKKAVKGGKTKSN
ncbi:uncharacterized protein LOC123207429 [Mangifera indica]|uniref:uncharacterized protein LOC123207429 n=1 Tax=Mangifera indica TaxID=29780 RepID=UPI001CF98E26|nr:uncharacterized protein LOC123207429 [Mangifera indica]XP_044480773.1 uncharacterized protein LOC123207429 [Mangifera indica]XP_044480782.1 uncharacterized protein LOC123207429 [Mangifera indica]XP_044480788.1 uncharacterized protein LOC123207429 [Mangifera indica]XP_044480794.1 uncharacterized protein LOC123207429 [Mangifera indica]XP_044480802.1 uncharacterized protein LOC123207429 [Mangifera indica]XP_044480810.1 uncharacterized protein LOC123207429 [Mangifera indica]XP_044480819.1 unc